MTADVNVTELLARALAETLRAEHPVDPGESLHGWRCRYPDEYGPCTCIADTARIQADALVAVFRSPDVLAGMAGVLRDAEDEWGRLHADAPQGHPPTRSQWQARAVVDWLAGGGE